MGAADVYAQGHLLYARRNDQASLDEVERILI